ncbi:hypothetical protein GOBAR_DD34578 [Gossypium barbadense]|nr:hypothetical protein GOBAR_DD34578 [Gossypium barbadense]
MLMICRHHATVTIVHACTKNPERITCEADIVVTAAGVPSLIRSSWLKPGAVVIDVGTCPVEDPSAEYGYRLVGDVCYEEPLSIASAVTPVPGGVGPMTIAMLLCNTLDSAKRLAILKLKDPCGLAFGFGIPDTLYQSDHLNDHYLRVNLGGLTRIWLPFFTHRSLDLGSAWESHYHINYGLLAKIYGLILADIS